MHNSNEFSCFVEKNKGCKTKVSVMVRLTGIAAVILGLVCNGYAETRAWSAEEETTEYWYAVGEKELTEALSLEKLNTNVARNVIIFLGDGMGIPTITAGRIMKGQMQNMSGEDSELAMDRFHHFGMSKTYSVNKQTADSASTATAYLCGVKTNHYLLGLSGKARLDDCASVAGNEVNSILHDSYIVGKSTGIVTTTQLAHATPAAAYSHSASRRYYSDANTPSGCTDIALQLYEKSDEITVALGGGRKYFTPNTVNDPEYPTRKGDRLDSKDLITMWQNKHADVEAKYVWDQAEFDAVDPVTTDKLLGMFDRDHMKYEVDRADDTGGEPSIAEMTEKAIRILRKNSKGYFLLVEGGRIDHGHHSSNAYRALTETVAFDEAIQKALDLTTDSDTLIIVTADHSHTMNMGGYSDRGNPILGLAPAQADPEKALDLKPYTTILYGNGPGFQGAGTYLGEHERTDPSSVDTMTKNYIQQSAVPLPSETHGGEDVAILARGPMSHLFHGVHEQNYIAHVMRYASCVGGIQDHCSDAKSSDDSANNDVTQVQQPVASVFLGMELNVTETQIALYVQFVLLLCMVLFTIFLGVLVKKKVSSNVGRKGKTNHAATANDNHAYDTVTKI